MVKARAEDSKETLIRLFLELQREREIPYSYLRIGYDDPGCVKPKSIKKKFQNPKSGIYLFILSTEDDIRKSLRKINGERTTGEEVKPLIPVYVGVSGKLKKRFQTHPVVKTYMSVAGTTNLWRGQDMDCKYRLYLMVAPLDYPMALAMESVLLNRFDFIFNRDHNKKCRVVLDEENARFKDDDVEAFFVNPQEVRGPSVQGNLEFAGEIVRMSEEFKSCTVNGFRELGRMFSSP